MRTVTKIVFLLLYIFSNNIVAAESAHEKDKIFIRTGIHKNYFRIVFNISKKVDYKINRISNALEIKFLEDFEFTSKSLHEKPNYITDIKVDNKPEDNAMVVTIMAPIKSKIRKFWYGNALVVDVFKPNFLSDYNDNKDNRKNDKSKTKLVSNDLDKTQTTKSGAYESLAKNIIYSTNVKINDDNSFIIAPEIDTKCAIFKYAGANYIAFNKKLSEKEIKQSLSGLFSKVAFIYDNRFSILKINNGAPITINATKVSDNNGWLFMTESPHVDFSVENEVSEKIKKQFNFTYNITSLDQPYFKINNIPSDKSELIGFEDAGNRFKVIIADKISNQSPQYFNDLELLESSYGIVILDRSNNIKVSQKDNDLIVTNKNQNRLLSLSSPQDRTRQNRDVMIPSLVKREYRKNHPEIFEKIEDDFINKLSLAKVSDPEKNATIHLGLANFYLDNELYFEAASNLEEAIAKDPRLSNSKEVLSELAFAWLMAGNYDKSSNIIHSQRLLLETDLNPYRVVIYSKKPEIARLFDVRKYFELKPLIVEIARVPENVQDFIKEETMKFSLDNGFAIDNMLSSIPDKIKDNDIRFVYYQARNALLHEESKKAEALFNKVLSMHKQKKDSEIYTVPAKYHKIMIGYNDQKISIETAIEKLDTMRYLWIDQNQRLQYLTTMNKLYDRAGYASNLIDNTIYIKNLYPDYFENNPKLYQSALKHFKDALITEDSFNDSLDLVVFYKRFKDYFEIDDMLDKVTIYEKVADALDDLYLLDDAENMFSKILKIKDKDHKIDKDYYRYKLAKVYLDMGKYKKTIATIRKIKSYDKNIEITKALSNAMLEVGKFKEVKKIVTNKKYQDSEDILKISLKLAFESSDNLLARNALKKLLSLQLNKNKVDPNTVISLSAILKEMGDVSELEKIKSKYAIYIKDPKQVNLFNEISRKLNKPALNLKNIETILSQTNNTINTIKDFG